MKRLLLLALLLPALLQADDGDVVSTISGNVRVLGAMPMQTLDRARAIRIYLPPDYADSDRRYPVLYMHDAQNLFDDATSYAGEWGIDETLDELASSTGLELIVVGIDNGQEKRMNELTAWPNPEHGTPEGREYVDFIVSHLKPRIDAEYRTLSDPANTGIMGSSMGGLISHYAILEHPDVFGRAGVFSPSFWFSDDVFSYTEAKPLAADARIFMLTGSEEGPDMVDPTLAMRDLFAEIGAGARVRTEIVDGAEHNERSWRAQFGRVAVWLFSNDQLPEPH